MTRFCFRCALRVDAGVAHCPQCGGNIGELFDGASTAPPTAGYRLKKLERNDADRDGLLAGFPSIKLVQFDIDPAIIALIPGDLARRLRVVPVNRAGASLVIAMEDPLNLHNVDEVYRFTELNIEVLHASADSITAALEKYYP